MPKAPTRANVPSCMYFILAVVFQTAERIVSTQHITGYVLCVPRRHMGVIAAYMYVFSAWWRSSNFSFVIGFYSQKPLMQNYGLFFVVILNMMFNMAWQHTIKCTSNATSDKYRSNWYGTNVYRTYNILKFAWLMPTDWGPQLFLQIQVAALGSSFR